MKEYLNKKQLCKVLNISPGTAQKELNRAIKDGCGAVIKMGRTLRIDFDRFVEWNSNKNREQLKGEEKWVETKTEKGFTNVETYGGFIIPKEEYNIASQLRKRVFRKL